MFAETTRSLLLSAEAKLAGIERSVQGPFRRVWQHTGCTKGLEFLWLELTRSCNLSCVHCYAGSGPRLPLYEGMTFEDWRRVLADGRSSGCRRVQFIGGEPTIHPELTALIDAARSLGYAQIELFTNATRLDRRLLESLKRNRVHVAFSFYSTDPRVHDRITGVPGSHRECVEGIEALSAAGLKMRASIIMAGQTAAQAAAAQRFLRSRGILRIGSDHVRRVGRAAASRPSVSAESELCGQCWRRTLCVTASGETYPCVFSRFVPLGNAREESLGNILEGNPLKHFRLRRYLAN